MQLTHWGWVTHISVGKLTIIGSDNGVSPGRRQAIIWTNAAILLNGPLGTNFSEILIGVQTFPLKKMHLKMLSTKWHPLCLGLNVLTHWGIVTPYGDIELGQHWLRLWLDAWQHQAITWTNVDLSSVRSTQIFLGIISEKISQPLIPEISLKIICLNFHSKLPGANELISVRERSFRSTTVKIYR